MGRHSPVCRGLSGLPHSRESHPRAAPRAFECASFRRVVAAINRRNVRAEQNWGEGRGEGTRTGVAACMRWSFDRSRLMWTTHSPCVPPSPGLPPKSGRREKCCATSTGSIAPLARRRPAATAVGVVLPAALTARISPAADRLRQQQHHSRFVAAAGEQRQLEGTHASSPPSGAPALPFGPAPANPKSGY